ncbi:hypothetical protein [Carbonactinospora thermoautotrophica]|nr:hypothetical protein [Carbonactinospora thermoautotrophica]
MYLIAGRACALLANASMDYGQYRDAMRQARTAWTLADRAGHVELQAWIRGMQSSIAYWSGRPREAAQFAAAGENLPTRGTICVFLASLEARALGRLGDVAGVEAAVRKALAAREKASVDEIGGVFAFPEAKQHLYAGSAYAWLNCPQKAQAEATRAITLYEAGAPEDRSYGDEAGARLDLALAHLHQESLDGARAAASPVLQLPVELRVSSIGQRLGRIARILTEQYRNAGEARTFLDEIAEFQSLTTRRQLPAGTIKD